MISPELLKMADEVTQGNASPLDTYIDLKEIEKTLKDCLESVKEQAITEAGDYPEKSFERKGAKVTKTMSRSFWDYKGVEEWNKQKKALKSIEESSQAAYKAAEKGQDLVEEGTVVQAAKYTPGGETITITLPK